MSPCLVLYLCAIGDICDHNVITLNCAGLFSIEARISTQLSKTSHGENEVVSASAFNMFTGYFVEFEQYFCSKTYHFTCNLGANMTTHVSEVELYIILSTLEKFKRWNLSVLITKY